MASSEQLKALLVSHLDKDGDRFLSIALQVAAHEARKGHGKLAEDIRAIVDKAKKKAKLESYTPVSIAKGVEDASGLLVSSEPKSRLSDLIADEYLKSRLERIVLEQRLHSKLRAHGLTARRKILLAGPPGTGKTFTASILAGELGFPLFKVRLDSLITKYMGESSAKLRQVFDAISNVRGVYFFDEFDALGSTRQSGNDVGEARRILNSFLQMIEEDSSNSLILCATNHIDILDSALFRRFDDVLRYSLPDHEVIQSLLHVRLGGHTRKNFPWKKLAITAEGLSTAELTRATDEALKEMLISDKKLVSVGMLEHSIEERKLMRHHLK